jgi:hypothetical protein
VFSAAQNAATVGCWAKTTNSNDDDGNSDASGAGGAVVGRMHLAATETISAYPHQIKAFDSVLVIGGRDRHYDDVKHRVPTARLVLFDLRSSTAPRTNADDKHGEDGASAASGDVPSTNNAVGGYTPRSKPIDITEYDAVAQLSGNGVTCAVAGYPRDAIAYDATTGKRTADTDGRKLTVLLLDMATWDRALDRLVHAHDDVITAVEMRGTGAHAGEQSEPHPES